MTSELQRVAQKLVEVFDQAPGIIAALQGMAAKEREHAALVVVDPSSSLLRDAALQLDSAARDCEDAAEKLALAAFHGRGWAQDMVDGVSPHNPPEDRPDWWPGPRPEGWRGPRPDESAQQEQSQSADEPATGTSDTGQGRPAKITLDLGTAADDAHEPVPDDVIRLSSTEPDDSAALNNPPPNATIDVDGRFTYRTDHLGRVVHASTTLAVIDPDHPRDHRAQRILEGRLDGDHAGHIFARLFQGPGALTNLVPMNGRRVNQGEYRSLENLWSRAIKRDGKQVDVKVDIAYEGDQTRPTRFFVSYKIEGEAPRSRRIVN